MSKKTEISQAPTSFTDKQSQGGASSCFVNKRRQMFQALNTVNSSSVNLKHLVQQNGTSLIPKNVLVMNPLHIKSLVWPQIFMPDQELSVSLKGNFYSIKDSRNKQRFINRNSMPNSQLIHFNTVKNGDKIVISSVQKFIIKNEENINELWYHFVIAIFNIETEAVEKFQSAEKGFAQVSSIKTAANLSSKIGQSYFLDFKGMQLIDNYKKAFVIYQPIGLQRTRYEVIMIDFHKENNNEGNQPAISQSTSFVGTKKFLGHHLKSKLVGSISLERKQTEVYKRLINSQFGDIVLLITSHQIYEIEIAGQLKTNEYTLILKPFLICKIFSQNKNTYVSNQTNQLVLSKEIFSQQEKIIDVDYLKSGLKIMILTSHGRVFVVQSEQCIFSESLYEMLSNKQMVQNYNIEYFVFKNIYFLRGLLVVQVQAQKKQDCNLHRQAKYEDSILDKLDERKNNLEYSSRGLIIAKVQSNSLSFSKFISLPFHLKDYEYFRVHPFSETDQLLLQAINIKNLQALELYRCQIISNKNSFMPFIQLHCIKQPKINLITTSSNSHKIERELENRYTSKVAFGKSHKSLYILKGHEVSGYRIHNNEFVSVLQNGIQKTLSVSFFERPIKIIVNPLTGQLVILYRQFIKFFLSVYSQLKLQLVMNLRDVRDINYTKYGESLIISMNDNSIYLVDSYRLTDIKIMDFYGDVKELNCSTEYILAIKSTKNVLNIFRKKQTPTYSNSMKNNSEALQFYDKLYQIKLENEDLYHVDDTFTFVAKKDGSLEIYSHIPEERVSKSANDQKQMVIFKMLQKQHCHLINRKKLSFQKSEFPTYCLFSSQFSTLFIGTSHGKIKQYLYPFLSIEDPSSPQAYSCTVSNTEIIHIELNGDFSSLYAISELGQVLQLKFDQFLNGHKKNGIYVISKTQSLENSVKYEFANRNYLINDYTSINDQQKRTMYEQYEQTCFADDKIKNDIQDVTSRIKTQSTNLINKLAAQKKNIEKTFKNDFNLISIQMKAQEKLVKENLEELRKANQSQKQSMINEHEKELLDIYRQNDRLKYVLTSKTEQFARNTKLLRQQLKQVLQNQILVKEQQLQKLESQYKQLESKYEIYSGTISQEINSNNNQLQTFKHQEIAKFQEKLKNQELRKQSQLSRMGKIQKEIERYKKRAIYFENITVQTRNQIQQLQNDIKLYDQKKASLIKELQQKQLTIEQKQTQLVKYLKTTNEMKKIKNVHEFELTEFQTDLIPVQDKIIQLEKQVQNLNNQIMDQFNSKVQHDYCIVNSQKRIQKLKAKNYAITQNLLKSRTLLLRFTEGLTVYLEEDPFADDLRKKLTKIVDNFSKQNEFFTGNEEIEKSKKEGINLIRKKNMLTKAIQREQKLQEGVLRNKIQFFRYYTDNTNLVKQYNQLFKDHNILMHQKNILLEKVNNLKANAFKTPLKRTTSLHIRKVSEKKLTPFQKYEQQQIHFNTIKLKQGDTTETRVSRGESTSFLKSLIKDVSIAQSQLQKSNMIRDRIRTFVNPEMQRKTIQKQLFQKERERGKSNHVPLLKL